jgi:excisionase family DNA binding protein
VEEVRGQLGDKVGYSEEEAARLLSLNTWTLRDMRRRGEIKASVCVGRRIRYTRGDLERYLLEHQSK